MAREPFNDLWANTPTNPGNDASFSEPRATIFDTGWEGGADKDAPKAGEQNWWQNRADSALQDIERYGVMTWDADAIYAAGAPVKAADNNYYESLTNTNTANDPTSSAGFWRLIGTSLYSIVPVGSVISIAHSGVPDTGWLKCNGAILTRTSYARLFTKLGTTWNDGTESTVQFRIPDLRGELIRGFDDARGIDIGRAFGSLQLDSLQNITGGFGDMPRGLSGGLVTGLGASGAFYVAATSTNVAAAGPGTVPYAAFAFDASRIVRTSTETRPRNRAMNFWIKY